MWSAHGSRQLWNLRQTTSGESSWPRTASLRRGARQPEIDAFLDWAESGDPAQNFVIPLRRPWHASVFLLAHLCRRGSADDRHLGSARPVPARLHRCRALASSARWRDRLVIRVCEEDLRKLRSCRCGTASPEPIRGTIRARHEDGVRLARTVRTARTLVGERKSCSGVHAPAESHSRLRRAADPPPLCCTFRFRRSRCGTFTCCLRSTDGVAMPARTCAAGWMRSASSMRCRRWRLHGATILAGACPRSIDAAVARRRGPRPSADPRRTPGAQRCHRSALRARCCWSPARTCQARARCCAPIGLNVVLAQAGGCVCAVRACVCRRATSRPASACRTRSNSGCRISWRRWRGSKGSSMRRNTRARVACCCICSTRFFRAPTAPNGASRSARSPAICWTPARSAR